MVLPPVWGNKRKDPSSALHMRKVFLTKTERKKAKKRRGRVNLCLFNTINEQVPREGSKKGGRGKALLYTNTNHRQKKEGGKEGRNLLLEKRIVLKGREGAHCFFGTYIRMGGRESFLL